MFRCGPQALSRLFVVGTVLLACACSAFMPEIGAVRGADDAAAPAGDARAADASSDRSDGSAVLEVDAAPTTFTVVVGPGDSHTFSPAALDIKVGDTVHWEWAVSGHTVTSGSGGSADGLFCSPSDGACSGAPTSAAGATYDHRFTTAGTFPYFCRPHFNMKMIGIITVQ